jgi:hypothetical protein
MSDVLDRLRERLLEMSDDEIREALGSPEELRADALEMYHEEAIRRGLSMPGEPEPEDEEPVESGRAASSYPRMTVGLSASRPPSEEAAPKADEFTAGDREVECFHCGGKSFVEQVVALPVRSEDGMSHPLPVSLLQCVDCGCLLWFGEPLR